MADEEEDRISDLPDELLFHIVSFLELREAVETCVLSGRWKELWTSIHRFHLINKDLSKEKQDRISGLPDDVLFHILSFLELREAVKTSVLSKRWEKVWTSIHRIHLNNRSCLYNGYPSDQEVERRRASFNNFVNGVLIGSNSKLSVTSFSLSYAFGLNLYREIMYLNKWIAAVVTPKLQVFDFRITDGYLDLSTIRLPTTLFQCQKLEILKLNCNNSIMDIYLLVPRTVRLSKLAKLHLVGVALEDENSLKNLLSGCPVLEELVMEEITVSGNGNRNRNLFVLSPSLKILRMETYHAVCSPGFGCCYVVDAPKLEYLVLADYSLLGFTMSSSPSLVSAVIDTSTILSNTNPLSLVGLFRDISNVQELELSTNNIFMCEEEFANLPEFRNLIHLKMRHCNRNRHIVNCILQKSPNLKHLVFDEVYFSSESFMWSQPDSVPKCLELHLEMIEISVRSNIDCAMKIIEYLLDKGKVLEKMAITTAIPVENSILMGFSRASVGCQIVINNC